MAEKYVDDKELIRRLREVKSGDSMCKTISAPNVTSCLNTSNYAQGSEEGVLYFINKGK